MTSFRHRNERCKLYSAFISYKHWRRILAFLLFVLFFFVSYFFPINDRNLPAFAQTSVPCATPGKDGPSGTLSSIINTYYPSPASVSVSAGATSIPVGSPFASGTPAIASGDLLLVIQMQDADINSTNTDAYGNGTSGDVPAFAPPGPPYTDPPSTAASGWTSTNAGKYEFVIATNAVSSGSISISGLGSSNGLLNSYVSSPASTTKGQSSYQVIRVPQFSSATLGNVIASPWNGSTGGVVVYDVAGNLDLTGTVNASGRGFRGGGGRKLSGASGANTDYRTLSTVTNNGSKAEGIAGTPRFVNITNFDATQNPTTTPTVFDNGAANEGYPNGSYGRGAPGNAGGGSTDGRPSNNDQNSGGGGGGNGGRGGRGGRSWSSQYPTGGFGGKEFSLAVTDRIVLGGGGGAGTTNDGTSSPSAGTTGTYSSGAAGGGMVIIRTNTVSNTGTILANGANAPSVAQDGGGGGGAGGSVLVTARTGSLAGLTVSVKGGKGGDANFSAAHGPGGGGGGGVIISTTPAVTLAAGGLDGGAAGVTSSNSLGANFTSESGTGLLGTISATTVPGIKSGAECSAQLTVTKTTSTPNINNQPTGTTATYAIAVSNAVSQATATSVSISDSLPSGFTYGSTASITLTGGATQPTTSNPTAGSSNPTWGQFTIPGGGQVQITFVVNVSNTVAVGTYQNPATATYLDPGRTTATGTKSVSYDSASSTGEDVTVASVSTLAGKVIINEVLYNETRTTTVTNDEFIELYNASSSPVDLSGLKLADGNLIVNNTDGLEGFSYTFPSGTILQSGQYAVLWIGDNNANHQATAATFQAWLAQIPKLNNSGDDVWLYDSQNKIIDYIAYGAGSEVNTPPPSSLNLWDNSYQSTLTGASSGQSISLTPNGKDTDVSACWEATTSANASTRCPNYLPTIDTDSTGSRVTSVGKNNNGATAKLLLVKRITRINNQDLTEIVDGRSDVPITAANYVPAPYDTNDNNSKWPANYLRGLINAGTVKPGDELEYTIYFLSSGNSAIKNVSICDLMPVNTTFVPTAFTSNSGIALAIGSTAPVSLTNFSDSDGGQFIVAGTETPGSCNKAAFSNPTPPPPLPAAQNLAGAVVVDVVKGSTTFPDTTPGSPAYGFIRLRAKVK